MLLVMHINTVFPLVNMEMEAFEQTLSLHKDGDGGYCKIAVICRVAYYSIKRNEILQPNILIYFKAILNVIQGTMIVR